MLSFNSADSGARHPHEQSLLQHSQNKLNRWLDLFIVDDTSQDSIFALVKRLLLGSGPNDTQRSQLLVSADLVSLLDPSLRLL